MNYNNKIVYQIYPRSFMDTTGNGIGDLNGIISKLDYIKELGVDYIWLSPINESPQNDNGYDISDYYKIDPLFGDIEIYKKLIEEANKRGMKIMLDLVLNHTSDEHEWFKKALEGDEYYQDFYVWTDKPNDLKGFFWNDAWEYNKELDKYYLHLFDKSQPDLNWHNPNVREELYKMINFWIDLGVEGFRLDVIDLIGKEPLKKITGKGPKYVEYMQEMNARTFKNKFLTVGECWNSTLDEAIEMCEIGGLAEIFHFSHITLTSDGEKWKQKPLDLGKFIKQIKMWQNDYEGNQTIVMNNHDIPRLMSVWLNDNTFRYESATCLANFFSMLNGTQYIYQGEEIGMTNAYKYEVEDYRDVETFNKYNEFIFDEKVSHEVAMKNIAIVSRDNARIPMQWDSKGGFSFESPWIGYAPNTSEVNVETDLNSDKSIYKYYKELIKFKKENYEKYINGKIEEIKVIDNCAIYYKKKNLVVYSNFSENNISIDKSGEILFNNYEHFNGELKPYQSLILRINNNT